MKYLLSFAVFSYVLMACGDKATTPEIVKDLTLEQKQNCILDSASREVYDQLMAAYEQSCISCLEEILITWNEQSIPATNIPDSLKDLYEVYKAFYSPWDLARMSNSEFGDDIYEGVSYYIIQHSIRHDHNFRTDPLGDERKWHTPFRPEIQNDTIKMLYLNDTYEPAINCFLGANDHDYVRTPVDNLGDRVRFLSNFLLIIHGHWGNYWHLDTHPEAQLISFNQARDSALVSFRVAYEGGYAVLGKEDGNWVIVESEMVWIE